MTEGPDRDLDESAGRFRSLVEHARDLIAIFKVDGTFVYASPAHERVLGYAAEDLVGRVALEHVHSEDRESISETLRWLASHPGETMPWECRVRHRDGTWRTVEGVGTGLVMDPSVKGVSAHYRDVTDRLQIEARLGVERRRRALSTLAGGVAHDFNNTLSAVLGYTEMALVMLEDGSPAESNLRKVMLAAGRARQLVRQMQTFCSLRDPERKPIRLDKVASEVLDHQRSVLPESIDVQPLADWDGPSVLGDVTRLHQIVLNLCANAGHAMRAGGGVLSVALDVVDLGEDDVEGIDDVEPGRFVRLSVSDTGHGMDVSTLDRIFDPFFTTKARGSGTGLGLSVVDGIVRAHGGVIRVDSEPGHGSTFHVHFPAASEEDTLPAGLLDDCVGGTERLLLVDDEALQVDVGKQLLERLGYQVTISTSSRAALEMFRDDPERFDLVVTDMVMPEMTGAELGTELLAIRPSIPIVICTGYSEHLDAATARDLGFRAFALKPFTLKMLSRLVRNALDDTVV